MLTYRKRYNLLPTVVRVKPSLLAIILLICSGLADRPKRLKNLIAPVRICRAKFQSALFGKTSPIF